MLLARRAPAAVRTLVRRRMGTVAVDGGSRNLWTATADKLGRPAVANSRWMAEVRLREAKAARKAFTEAMSQYARIFEEYPMRINMVISGGLCALGDVLAQSIEQRVVNEEQEFSPLRTGRMLLYGTCVCGPLLHLWYGALFTVGEALSVSYAPVVGSRVGALLPWLGSLQTQVAAEGLSPGRLLVAKVAADGLFFQAPFLNLYFVAMGMLEGRGPLEILEKAKQAFHRAWGLSILVWTPVQLLNFAFIPAPFQPTVVSAVNVGWKTTLSLLNAKADTGEQAAKLRRTFSEVRERDLEEVETLRAEVSTLRDEVRALRLENEMLLVGTPPSGDAR
tara:strand:+ start:304 stop:1308 length:1005 start_codon:yes stop_codon:yes gene_type:complete